MKKLTQKEFKLPNAPSISSRKSTIAKALSDGIAPRVRPQKDEYSEYLKIFNFEDDTSFVCVYCGQKYDYLEHFRPLVKEKQPTGYGSDIYNLVPSCKNCNEKKKNNSWSQWMEDEKNEGKRDVEQHNVRMERLKCFEKWGRNKVCRVNYEEIIGATDWSKYLNEFKNLEKMMDKLGEIQAEIRKKLQLN